MNRRVGPVCLSAALAASTLPAIVRAGNLPDLESLATTPVYAASRHYLRQVDSPASVTVITADDIRSFGYRTLGDLLRSVRGVHIYNDRNYDYLTLRGYSRAGDYNAGVALQIDGMRINDPVYDGGLIGSEFPLDVGLIERVEYIRGPGSAEFGGNALFGVINIVTRSAGGSSGLVVGLDGGSNGRAGANARFGKRFENGASLLLSASYLDVEGEDLRFKPDRARGFPGGKVRDGDYDYSRRAFAKLEHGDFALTAGFGSRVKGDPAPYLAPYMFGQPNMYARDAEAFANLRYVRDLSETNRLTARLYYGHYDYLGHWPLDLESGRQTEHDVTRADWSGTELRLETLLGTDLRVVSGVEHQRDFRLSQHDMTKPDRQVYYDFGDKASRTSAYAQADYGLTQRVTLTGGLRLDRTSPGDTEINPRLGLIYKPGSNTAWKFLYGRGARNASPYERLWSPEGVSLDAERVENAEITLEHYFAPRTRGVASLFGFHVHRVVKLIEDADSGGSYYANTGEVRGRGIEFEIDHVADTGTHLRTSIGYNRVRNDERGAMTNSPRWLAKVNLSRPLPWFGLRAGLEGQWTSAQHSYLGRVSSIGLVNLTLLRPLRSDGWEASASVYNLCDRRYADPLATDSGALTNGVIPQTGRSFRVTLNRRF